MHTTLALVCALLGLAISPLLAKAVANPPLWEPSDDVGLRLEGRTRLVVTGLLTALLFGLAGGRLGWETVLAPVLVLFAGLVIMSLVDVTIYRIPDRVLFPTYLTGLVLIVAISIDDGLLESVWWGLGCSALCYVFLKLPRLVLGRAAMGGGDIKLAALMGLYLGWVGWSSGQPLDALRLTLVGLLLGAVLGILGGLPTAVRNGLRTHYPFGPTLALATVVGVLWSGELLAR